MILKIIKAFYYRLIFILPRLRRYKVSLKEGIRFLFTEYEEV